MGCPHCQQMGALLDGELSASERAVKEAHLQGCFECTLELQELQRMSRLLSVALEAARHAPHAHLSCSRLRQRRLLRWSKVLAFAASLFFAVSGSLLLETGARPYSSTDIAWEQSAVAPQLLSVRIDSIDPVAQKLLGMRP